MRNCDCPRVETSFVVVVVAVVVVEIGFESRFVFHSSGFETRLVLRSAEIRGGNYGTATRRCLEKGSNKFFMKPIIIFFELLKNTFFVNYKQPFLVLLSQSFLRVYQILTLHVFDFFQDSPFAATVSFPMSLISLSLFLLFDLVWNLKALHLSLSLYLSRFNTNTKNIALYQSSYSVVWFTFSNI